MVGEGRVGLLACLLLSSCLSLQSREILHALEAQGLGGFANGIGPQCESFAGGIMLLINICLRSVVFIMHCA